MARIALATALLAAACIMTPAAAASAPAASQMLFTQVRAPPRMSCDTCSYLRLPAFCRRQPCIDQGIRVLRVVVAGVCDQDTAARKIPAPPRGYRGQKYMFSRGKRTFIYRAHGCVNRARVLQLLFTPLGIFCAWYRHASVQERSVISLVFVREFDTRQSRCHIHFHAHNMVTWPLPPCRT